MGLSRPQLDPCGFLSPKHCISSKPSRTSLLMSSKTLPFWIPATCIFTSWTQYCCFELNINYSWPLQYMVLYVALISRPFLCCNSLSLHLTCLSGSHSKSRLQQLVDWCGGRDFSGCIIFDECHKAKNFVPGNEKRSTKVSMAVTTIQKWDKSQEAISFPYKDHRQISSFQSHFLRSSRFYHCWAIIEWPL